MERKLKILFAEDNLSDTDLIKYEISKSNILFDEMIVETEDDFIVAIQTFEPDLILSDYSMPGFDGMRALKIRQELIPHIPFILVTGSINEETAVEIMKTGADDYIIKDNLKRLGEAVKAAIKKYEIITAKKKADEQIRILSRSVVQNPASIVITNTKGDIEYVNPKFTLLTGYSSEEAIGKNPRLLKTNITTPEEYKNLWDTITSGNDWHGEFQNCKKNGDIYFESATISPIFNDEGIITHFVAVKEDITEKRKMVLDLIAAKEKAEESDKLKSAFLANMSHEIRTPMNGILGFAELLKQPDLSGDSKQAYIEIIEKSGKRMLNIINDIVSISKIESGLVEVNINNVNINNQIEYVYTFFKPEAEAKGIKLSFNCSLPSSESIIKTDHDKFLSILTNLVKNAIKYTEKGTIELGYILKKDADHAQVEFYIKDTGIGIKSDRQQAIFRRFIQADIEDKMARQGAGLGLSISKAYAEMLDGKLWVKSEAEKGSTFYFTIPYTTKLVAKGKIKIDISAEDINNLNKSIKILIVEDDETSTLLLLTMLEKINCEILQAINGAEAVEHCRKNPDLDIVLMDIKMPLMNGYDAIRQIRKFNKNVNIIAQTAYALSKDPEKVYEVGCDGYLAKPIIKSELFSVIKNNLIN